MTNTLPQLVSTDWLADHLEDEDLRVFDTTVHMSLREGGYNLASGRESYAAGHVPGAGFLDLTAELSDRSSPLGFTMPSPAQMGEALGAAGIAESSRVVVYSTSHQMWATRVWWMLRSSGLEAVALLDGGFAKWKAEGRPVSDAPCAYPAASLVCGRRDEMWADKEEVLRSIEDGAVCTINALPRPLHTGEAEMSYGRKGRIAGSRNVPYDRLLDAESQVYRAPEDLRAAFDEIGAMERQRVICYCGGGISATTDAFALKLVGHPDVAVYDGSLQEWAGDPDLPMETG